MRQMKPQEVSLLHIFHTGECPYVCLLWVMEEEGIRRKTLPQRKYKDFQSFREFLRPWLQGSYCLLPEEAIWCSGLHTNKYLKH